MDGTSGGAGRWGESTPLAGLSFVCLDFEGAGQRPGDHEDPVQIGIATLGPEGSIDPAGCFDSLLRPRRAVTAAARRVHGIGDGQLRGAPSLAALWPELRPRLRAGVLVAFGAATEKRYLEGLPGQDFGPWVDVLPLLRASFPQWPEHGLGTAAERLGLTTEVESLCAGRRWHDALFDAVATAVLLRWLLGGLNRAGAGPDAGKGGRGDPGVTKETLGCLLHPDLSGYYLARGRRAPTARPKRG